MRSFDNRLPNVTSTHLSIVTGAATNLLAQLSELNELRERVRKAELSARRLRRSRARWPRIARLQQF
jgi:hypothetical protein